MAVCVCNGASIMCSFGTTPSTLTVIQHTVLASNPVATIMDNKPLLNILPFGMCNSVMNPMTIKPPPVMFAPAPCIPNTTAPWAPGSPTVIVGQMPALNNTSKLMCMWGGVIQIMFPGQTTVMVP